MHCCRALTFARARLSKQYKAHALYGNRVVQVRVDKSFSAKKKPETSLVFAIECIDENDYTFTCNALECCNRIESM